MIDWNRVTELRDEIGAEDFSEVFDLFLDEVQGVIARLRRDLRRDDLESDLHFLKGSALNLGFSAFADKCQAGERQAANGRFDQVNLPAILGCFDRSLAEFNADLPKRFAA